MAAALPPPSGGGEDRGRPRRVNALLNAYYSLPEGQAASGAQPAASSRDSGQAFGGSELDRQGFDAKRYFDGMVHSGRLPDLVKRSKDLDSEVQSLDTEMQKLVYENYTHFTRAAGVISRMKVCLESLEPDINKMECHLSKMSKFETQAEACVSENGGQLERVLQRRQLCQKLEMLFGLPAMLTHCLDRGSYDLAARAYTCCAAFLAQHRDVASFGTILEDADTRIAVVRELLQQRIRTPGLSVSTAIQDASTLLTLAVDLRQVTGGFLSGRTATLQELLEECFVAGAAAAELEAAAAPPESAAEALRQEQDVLRPESVVLTSVCSRITRRYLPSLLDVVDGLRNLQAEAQRRSGEAPAAAVASDFVAVCLGDVFRRLLSLVRSPCPPTKVLVQRVRSLNEALKPLESRLPRLLPGLFAGFAGELAEAAADALFAAGAEAAALELRQLHGRCRRRAGAAEAAAEDKQGPADDVLEDVAKTEHALIMNGFTGLSECQPLLGLLEGDSPAAERLVRKIQCQLVAFFLVLADLCFYHVGEDPGELRRTCGLPPCHEGLAAAEVAQFSALPWCELFGLALVRMGRHFEVKVIGKVFAVAQDMFAASAAAAALVPPPALIRAARGAAQAVITHYTLTAGHALVTYLRNAVAGHDWLTAKEPRDVYLPAQVVRHMYTWDAQLALILGDPRRDKERRLLALMKSTMELEMERMLAKKVQTFAATPFNRNGVEVGILRIGFKALYELAREGTFGTFGLQQLQVDCALLSAFVQDFVDTDDSGALCSLLSEAVSSAVQRCKEPELMHSARVEALCEEKRRELKLC